MSKWQITISGKNIRKDGVEALVKKLKEKYGEKAHVAVEDASPPDSRADRFSAACSAVSDAKSDMEELRDELQEWKDNLPENLQDGSKAGELDDAISSLEDVISQCEDIEGAEVSFPAMM